MKLRNPTNLILTKNKFLPTVISMLLIGLIPSFMLQYFHPTKQDFCRKMKGVSPMNTNTYQPFLNYDLAIPNPAMVFPTVMDNYNFSVLSDIEVTYYEELANLVRRHRKSNLQEPIADSQGFLFPELAKIEIAKERERNPKGAGRRPKDFLALFKSFTGARYLGIDVNSRSVCMLLNSNPAFLERVSFPNNQVPSYRVIDRFDQVMTESNLWEKAARVVIQKNIDDKVINPRLEDKLVIDTTHIPARAKKGKLIKACRKCKAKDICPYKITTDDNAGVLIKSKNEVYFARKVGLSSLTVSKLPIDWLVNRGETYDGHFFCPLLQSFKNRFPMFNISKAIVDAIFNYKDNYLCAQKYLEAQLVAPINSRKCKEIPNPARGIKKITKQGQPICIDDRPMFLITRNEPTREFIWGCLVYHPESPEYDPQYICPMRNQCSNAAIGRVYRTKADKFPQICWDFPQFSKIAKSILALRTSIEREIGLLKEALKMESLWKRGKKNVNAHVAKCLIAMHMVAWVAHKTHRDNLIHSIKTFHLQK
jgi:hypothetical protein